MANSIRKRGSIFCHFFSFYKDDYKECPLTTFEKFSKRSFAEICRKFLTKSAYINLNFNNICLDRLGK